MSGKETSGELYESLFEIASEKLAQVLEDFADKIIEPLPQQEESATYTFSPSHDKSTHIYKEDALIDWNKSADVIEREVRAYNPWPISWTYLKELEKARCLDEGKIKLKPHVNGDLMLKIYSTDIDGNKLRIKQIQVEGKKQTNWNDFKNGYLVS